MIHKSKPIRSKKIRNSARGELCTARIPFYCTHNPEETVLAHLNGGGMAMKNHDIEAAYACSGCHRWLDGEYLNDPMLEHHPIEVKTVIRDAEHARAAKETRNILLQKGLIEVK